MKNYHAPVRVPDPIRFVWFVLIMLGALLVIHGCSGMDRWAALSMIESGDNDYAVGKSGEVSRYQIRTNVWRIETCISVRYATNHLIAKSVAVALMNDRQQELNEGSFTDFQFALIWHCPSRWRRPTLSDIDYAQRFYNLVHKEEIERSGQ